MRTHGASVGKKFTPAYRSWRHMHSRCYCKTSTQYPWYGGRGITVCERWADFANFLADMGERPEGKSLDRIDVNGNYSPENCRWATKKEQIDNRRDRCNTQWLTLNGVTLSTAHWAKKVGVGQGSMRYYVRRYGWPQALVEAERIKQGWLVKTKPPGRKRKEKSHDPA